MADPLTQTLKHFLIQNPDCRIQRCRWRLSQGVHCGPGTWSSSFTVQDQGDILLGAQAILCHLQKNSQPEQAGRGQVCQYPRRRRTCENLESRRKPVLCKSSGESRAAQARQASAGSLPAPCRRSALKSGALSLDEVSYSAEQPTSLIGLQAGSPVLAPRNSPNFIKCRSEASLLGDGGHGRWTCLRHQ